MEAALKSLGATLLKAGAPILGSAIAGPVGGALAGTIIGALADAFNVPATPEAVGKAIETRPEAPSVVASVEAEQGPAVLDELNARLKNIEHARDTTVKLVEQGSAIAWGAPVISAIVMAGFAVLSYLAIYAPAQQREVLLFLLGAWNTMAGGVVAYWTGSSAQSRSKDSTISTLAKR